MKQFKLALLVILIITAGIAAMSSAAENHWGITAFMLAVQVYYISEFVSKRT